LDCGKFIPVQKATAIFLLVLMVSIQTPLGQVFKFPLLVEHFLKHQKQGSASLIDFIQDHYTSGHRDADWPEDEQLPFKNITLHSIGFAILTPVVQSDIVALLPAGEKMIFPDNYNPQQHVAGIFHPPRV
jgi:hypothetical protein